MPPNIEPACRACLDSKGSLVFLFSGKLFERYEECTALNVSQGDGYPQHLCATCSGLLDSLYKFRKQCRRAQETWKTIIQKSQEGSTFVVLDVGKDDIKDQNNDAKKDHIKEHNDYFSTDEIKEEIDEVGGSVDYSVSNFDDAHCTWVDVPPLLPVKNHIKKKKSKSVQKPCRVVSFLGQCDSCDRQFSYKTSLVKHVSYCNSLQKRRRSVPRDESILSLPFEDALLCGICEQSLPTTVDLAKHLQCHQDSSDLLCKVCQYRAIDFADLFCHRFSHQPAGMRARIACFMCTKTFHKVDRLEFHFRGSHLDLPPGLCKVCKKGFNNYKHFLQHQLMHSGIVYPCRVCDKRFTFLKSLYNHMSTHTGMKKYMCHLCGFKSRQASGLKSHHYRHHTNHQKIPCNHCGKSFKNSETLREHLARATTDKKFPCPVCQKGYRSEKEMLNHVKWHSDEKPYTCNICGSSYKAKAHLKCHMRNHTGERPYVCDICNMGFTSTNVLKRHVLTHTGEKAYACEYCEKRFAAKNNLKVHVSRHMAAVKDGVMRPLLQEQHRIDSGENVS